MFGFTLRDANGVEYLNAEMPVFHKLWETDDIESYHYQWSQDPASKEVIYQGMNPEKCLWMTGNRVYVPPVPPAVVGRWKTSMALVGPSPTPGFGIRVRNGDSEHIIDANRPIVQMVKIVQHSDFTYHSHIDYPTGMRDTLMAADLAGGTHILGGALTPPVLPRRSTGDADFACELNEIYPPYIEGNKIFVLIYHRQRAMDGAVVDYYFCDQVMYAHEAKLSSYMIVRLL